MPGAAAFIIDEAHQAPETASKFFSLSLSSRQLQDLCRDLLAESAEVSGAMAVLREPVADCLQRLRECQLAIAENMPERGSWNDLVRNGPVRSALQALDQSIIVLAGDAVKLENSARGMDGCLDRLREVQLRFDRFDADLDGDEVRWYERRGRGFAIHITPLEVSSVFNSFRELAEASWVFTSAGVWVALSLSGCLLAVVQAPNCDTTSIPTAKIPMRIKPRLHSLGQQIAPDDGCDPGNHPPAGHRPHQCRRRVSCA